MHWLIRQGVGWRLPDGAMGNIILLPVILKLLFFPNMNILSG